MAEIPSLASFPDGKLSNSEAQIQMDLALSCNADSTTKCAEMAKSQHKSRYPHRNISLDEAIC